jgi:hypothetical protein
MKGNYPMRFQETAFGGLALYIFLAGLTASCSIDKNVASPYVQDAIQQEPAFWCLSPVGDKLLYNTTLGQNQAQAIVRALTTDQEFTIEGCSLFTWLDNEHVYCYDFYDDDYEPFIVALDNSLNADVFQKFLMKEITPEKVELDRLLRQAKAIYKLSISTRPDILLILDTENTSQYYQLDFVHF